MILKPRNTLFNTTLKVWDIPNAELRRTYEGIVEFKDTGLMPKYLVKIFFQSYKSIEKKRDLLLQKSIRENVRNFLLTKIGSNTVEAASAVAVSH